MIEAYSLKEEVTSSFEWTQNRSEIDIHLTLPENISAYPCGFTDLCESRINILCGGTSLPCSG